MTDWLSIFVATSVVAAIAWSGVSGYAGRPPVPPVSLIAAGALAVAVLASWMVPVFEHMALWSFAAFSAACVWASVDSADAVVRRLMWRILRTFMPVALVVASFILILLTFVPDPEAPLDGRILAALIAGTIVGAGWIVTFSVSEYRASRDFYRRRRDTLYALQSEIFAIVSKLDNQDIRGSAQSNQGKILDGAGSDRLGRKHEFYPFATAESTPIVFDAVADNIPSLGANTVKAVLRFYAEYTDLRTMVLDSRSDTLHALSRERRVSFHKQLTKRRVNTLDFGLQALVAINSDLEIENTIAIPRSTLNLSVPTRMPDLPL